MRPAIKKTSFHRASASLGLVMMTVSSYVSYLNQTAQLPAVLYGGNAKYLTTLKAVAGVPVEFLGVLWFLLVIGVDSERTRASYRSLGDVLFWGGALILGAAVGLSYQAGFQTIPLIIATAVACWLWLSTLARTARPPSNVDDRIGLLRSLLGDWRLMTSRSGVLATWVLSLAAAALVVQYLSLTAAATGPDQRSSQLIRWYTSKPRVESKSLVEAGKVRVVVFSDYECPSCSMLVPEYQKITDRYRGYGRHEVELVTKDFPLNADCNAAVQTRMHPVACTAAAAVHFIRRTLGDDQAKVLSGLLYRKHGQLSKAEIERHIDSLGLTARFQQEHATDEEAVRQDARLGDQIGVNGTPSAFIDGRLVRNLTPQALETILDYHLGTNVGLQKVASK
jgi:protein-disulfide isomerase